MKKAILILAVTSSMASAQTINTPSGSYQVGGWGSTTVVTQTSRGTSSGVVPAVPVTVNPITGIGQVITPTGTYMIQSNGSSTTVIQTGKTR
jgi:hypothetical protein